MLRYNFYFRWHGRGLLNTCWDSILWSSWHGTGLVSTCCDTFCVLAGMVGVCSTHVDVHFDTMLALEGFGQHKLRYFFFPRWYGISIGQHELSFILYSVGMRRVWSIRVEIQFVSSQEWEGCCVLTSMGWIWSFQVKIHFCSRWHGISLVNTSWDTFCVLAGIVGFGQHQLTSVLCPRYLRMG